VEVKAQITGQAQAPLRLPAFLTALRASLQTPVINSWRGDGGAAAVHEGPLYWPPAGQGSPDRFLTAVPKIFFFLLFFYLNQLFLKFSCPLTIPPKSFSLLLVLGWDLMGFVLLMRQEVLQDLEYAMRTKVSSPAEPSFLDNPENP